MKKTEIIIASLTVIFFLLKLVLGYIPGVSTFTILFHSFLSLLYFHLGFAIFNNIRLRKIFNKESYKNISTLRIFGSIAAGLTLSIAIIGTLFKVMHWPGASVNLIFGFFGILIVSIISIIKYSKTKSPYYSKILSRNLVFGGIALFLILIPEMTWIQITYKDQPTMIEAYRKAFADPDNAELWQNIEKERQRLYTETQK
jgi:hypothetical protein